MRWQAISPNPNPNPSPKIVNRNPSPNCNPSPQNPNLKMLTLKDGERRPLVGEGNDIAEVKIVGKRKGEEDSSHDSKSCWTKRAKNIEHEDGDGPDGANLENLDIQNRQGDDEEEEVKECGEKRMLDSSTKQHQLRENPPKDGIDSSSAPQNGSTDQILPQFKRPRSAWMIFLADKRPEVIIPKK